jgi:hypothetical protein
MPGQSRRTAASEPGDVEKAVLPDSVAPSGGSALAARLCAMVTRHSRRRFFAAAAIIQLHPEWSDRAIASAAGLPAKTVRGIRRATGEDAQLHKRVGKDGRVRPVNAAAGRQLAASWMSTGCLMRASRCRTGT